MASFKDSEDREWLVEPTLLMARRLKQRSENPIDLMDANSLAAAFDDPYSRFDLLWEFCGAQAGERGINVDQFDRLLSASEDTFAASTRVLKEALIDFFQRTGTQTLAAVITQTMAARQKLESVAVAKVKSERVTKLIDLAVQAAESQSDSAMEAAERELQQQIHGKPSTN